MENETITPQIEAEIPETAAPPEPKQNTAAIVGGVIGGLVLLAAVIAAIVFLITGEADTTAKIRDVFIIFMALESLVIGIALIILIIQLARMINLLQNEIKPIMDSTNETVSTLRGTTQFLSDNLAEPVIKLNEYFAGLQSFLKIVRPAQKDNNK
jgi:hypothetical protein